jgi:hypothetical protein
MGVLYPIIRPKASVSEIAKNVDEKKEPAE